MASGDEAEKVYRELGKTLFPKSADLCFRGDFVEIEHVWTMRDIEMGKTRSLLYQSVFSREKI